MDIDGTSKSLLEFCERAKHLLAVDQGDFVRYVLTKQDSDDTQTRIDPIVNRVSPDDVLTGFRDYDSLLGISRHIEVNEPLTVYAVGKQDTLAQNLHIEHQFTTATVGFFRPLCSSS